MQLKQSQISENLKKLNAESISRLSDDDLYHYLRNEIGLSIGPMVQSTRLLYEKLLNDSIEHLDNIELFLNNFTKVGDERVTKSTKILDSGHGDSLNNSLTSLNQIIVKDHQSGRNGFECRNFTENNRQAISLSSKLNLSNKSNGSKSTRKNTDESDDSNKSTSLNVSLTQDSNITSPIPTIKITSDLETNFDNKWPHIQTHLDKSARCSTPIERQDIIKRKQITVDSHIASSFQSLNTEVEDSTSEYQQNDCKNESDVNLICLTNDNANVCKNRLSKPFKNVNLNRNVFKDFTSTNSQTTREVQNSNIIESNPNLGSVLQKTSARQFNKQSNLTSQQVNRSVLNKWPKPIHTNSLQFSDNEEENECGSGFEYKIVSSKNPGIRRRFSGQMRMPFAKNSYMKRNTLNYQTNHPPQKISLSWLKTILIVILCLFILSLVLALTSYF